MGKYVVTNSGTKRRPSVTGRTRKRAIPKRKGRRAKAKKTVRAKEKSMVKSLVKFNKPPFAVHISRVPRRSTVDKSKWTKPIDVGELAEKVKNELRVIYRKHAPTMLLKLPKLMAKFRGREKKLLAKVIAKYT